MFAPQDALGVAPRTCRGALWENGGVIITDFINLRKGKTDKKLGRIYSLSAGRNGKSLTHGGKKIVTLLNKIYTF